jgi:hypothetical protein
MGFLRRLAFYLGLILGLGTVAAAGTVLFTYLFTGKFVSFEMVGDRPKATLMTTDEVISMVKERASKSETESKKGEGGKIDVEA